MSPAASVLVLTAAFLVVAALERAPRLRFAPSPFIRPYLLTDAAWYVVATGSALLAILVVRPVLEPLRIGALVEVVETLPAAGRVALGVVLYDVVAFIVHRRLHRSDRLWAIHKVHHSSLRLDWLATTRTHLAEHAIRGVPAQLLLLLVGLSATAVAAAAGTYAVFALFGHSNLDLPLRRIEWLFITPRLHRLHHVPATTERNLGTILSVWDRVAGTLTRADTHPGERTGVPRELDSFPQRFHAAFRARSVSFGRAPARRNDHDQSMAGPCARRNRDRRGRPRHGPAAASPRPRRRTRVRIAPRPRAGAHERLCERVRARHGRTVAATVAVLAVVVAPMVLAAAPLPAPPRPAIEEPDVRRPRARVGDADRARAGARG